MREIYRENGRKREKFDQRKMTLFIYLFWIPSLSSFFFFFCFLQQLRTADVSHIGRGLVKIWETDWEKDPIADHFKLQYKKSEDSIIYIYIYIFHYWSNNAEADLKILRLILSLTEFAYPISSFYCYLFNSTKKTSINRY